MADNNLFDLKKRIKAAEQTHKITRTMQLIASSRLQRGKKMLAHYQDWFAQVQAAARHLPDGYFEPQVESARGRNAYIVFGGKKGLSGAYSPNLLQFARPLVQGHLVIAVGSAAQAAFPDAYASFDDAIPSTDGTAGIVQAARDLYERREVDTVCMIYMRSGAQITERLYPPERQGETIEPVIIEPSARVVFPLLFDSYIEALAYNAHLRAFIAEQIARVAAMDSATRNADEIIADLNAAYNRIRQTAITQEIIMVGNAAKGAQT